MITDNATIVWALILVGFAILGLTGAIIYYADKKPKKKSSKK